MEGKEILIVDDESAIRTLLHKKLLQEGYECQEANSAEQALAKLSTCPSDLVLLDINMPGKSGIDLLPEIKTSYPDIMVIMITAVAEISITIACMRQGADDYICKPFNLDDVAMSVKKTLEKRELQLQIKEYRQHLEEKVKEQTKDIRTLFHGAIESLVFALEAKDKYTAGHSRRVSDTGVAISRELGLSADDIEDLRWAGLLHDIGKIAVDQLIQNKPGRLTRKEYEHIMIHAQVGADIVKTVVNERIVRMIEHHHDHYDGRGLHQVVSGTAIPLGARILAVADAFDAMTSERPYRMPMSIEKAVDDLKRCKETQFDSEIVDTFLRIKKISQGEY